MANGKKQKKAKPIPQNKGGGGGGKRKGKGGSFKGLSSDSKTYLASLLCADLDLGARPTDSDVLYPTCTFQQSYDGVAALTASGEGGVKVIWGHRPTVATENSGTTAAAAFTYLAAGQLGGDATVTANFASCRLVSGSVQIEYLGATSNDTGRVMSCLTTEDETAPTATTTLVQARDYFEGRVINGVYSRYKPIDSRSFAMTPTSAANDALSTTVCHISGGPNAGAYRIRATANFEGIQSTSLFNIGSVSASPSDVLGFNQVRLSVMTSPTHIPLANIAGIVGSSMITKVNHGLRTDADRINMTNRLLNSGSHGGGGSGPGFW